MAWTKSKIDITIIPRIKIDIRSSHGSNGSRIVSQISRIERVTIVSQISWIERVTIVSVRPKILVNWTSVATRVLQHPWGQRDSIMPRSKEDDAARKREERLARFAATLRHVRHDLLHASTDSSTDLHRTRGDPDAKAPPPPSEICSCLPSGQRKRVFWHIKVSRRARNVQNLLKMVTTAKSCACGRAWLRLERDFPAFVAPGCQRTTIKKRRPRPTIRIKRGHENDNSSYFIV